MSALTHFDAAGKAHMVDVADKAVTHRVARAEGCIWMEPATLARIRDGQAAKGDVIGIARIAAIQGAKKNRGPRAAVPPVGTHTRRRRLRLAGHPARRALHRAC